MNLAPDRHTAAAEAFRRLLEIMDELRERCPWDREQTFESLRTLSIEELHELSEAILGQDMPQVEGELGDLLLHIVFYARLGAERGGAPAGFTMESVIRRLNEKLIRRHPHIYGSAEADTAGQVRQNWEAIKLKEGNKSALAGVPASLPSLIKAHRMQEKAAGVGFDFADAAGAWAKVREELAELEAEMHAGADPARRQAELGDLLFSIANYARLVGLNAEDALEQTNRTFKARFEAMEALAAQEGQPLAGRGIEALDALWAQAKRRVAEGTTAPQAGESSASPRK